MLTTCKLTTISLNSFGYVLFQDHYQLFIFEEKSLNLQPVPVTTCDFKSQQTLHDEKYLDLAIKKSTVFVKSYCL